MSDEMERVARQAERIAKIKEVGKWHFRAFSIRQIAEKTGLSTPTVQKYIGIIKDAVKESPDLDLFIRDVIARTGEELERLQQQELKLWETLDWASTMIPDEHWDDKAGARIPYVDPEGNALMKPRSPGYITQATGQLLQIGRQRAELLKIIGNKTDITVNLQFAQQMQTLIVEKMREIAPAAYAELRREIEVMAVQFEGKTKNVALNAPPDTIDAKFVEAEYAE